MTKNDKGMPEQCCRFELMNRENKNVRIFSMSEVFCEDTKLD